MVFENGNIEFLFEPYKPDKDEPNQRLLSDIDVREMLQLGGLAKGPFFRQDFILNIQ
jgi:hypothetical protein